MVSLGAIGELWPLTVAFSVNLNYYPRQRLVSAESENPQPHREDLLSTIRNANHWYLIVNAAECG